MVDELLEDKDTAERKKRLKADIKKMWEIYREHMQDGHIRSTDSIEDADEPSTPVRIQRSDSPGRQHRPPSFDVPAAPLGRMRLDFNASSSDMSRLATSPAGSHPRRSSPEKEGSEGYVAALPHRDLPGDLALQGKERGRTLGRQPSWLRSTLASPSRTSCQRASSQTVIRQRLSSPAVLSRVRQRSSSPVGSVRRASSPISPKSQLAFKSPLLFSSARS